MGIGMVEVVLKLRGGDRTVAGMRELEKGQDAGDKGLKDDCGGKTWSYPCKLNTSCSECKDKGRIDPDKARFAGRPCSASRRVPGLAKRPQAARIILL